MSVPQSEKVKKELQVLFKKFHLNLIIESNKTTVDYLDTTLNLLDGTYKPYQKPENTLKYIHKESPSKYHQTNSNYSRNNKSKSLIKPNTQHIMKRHSKNQVIMSSYSTNQQIRIQTTK